MSKYLAILAFLAVSAAVEDWKDLRVNYGLTPVGHFQRMPKLEREAAAAGWAPRNTHCESDGSALGFRYVKPGDNSLVLIYDVNGVIAGLQMLLPHSGILGPDNTFLFGENLMFNNQTYGGEEYFVITTYLVDPSIICTSGRQESDLVTEGTGQGVWIQNGPTPDDFMEIPFLRTDALEDGWSDNNCFPGMGLHSWYKMEDWAESNCDVQVPIFGLYNKANELLGFGFSVSGTVVNPHFENPPTLAVQLIAGDLAPVCLLDGNDLIGQTTMHIYFVDTPWLLNCL